MFESIDLSFQGAQPDELVSCPIRFIETVIDQLSMQFVHASREIVLQGKIWNDRIQQIEFDSVVSRVGADLARIRYFGAWDECFYPIGNVSDLIVLIIAADVYGLVVYLFPWCIHKSEESPRDVAAAERAFAKARELMDDPSFAMVVLDELNIALRYDYLGLESVIDTLVTRRPGLHVVVTGRNAKPELIAAADLVTEMTLVKHHFAAGVKAQPGIEF